MSMYIITRSDGMVNPKGTKVDKREFAPPATLQHNQMANPALSSCVVEGTTDGGIAPPCC